MKKKNALQLNPRQRLSVLSRAINDREEEIQAWRAKTISACQECQKFVIEQGAALIEVKELVGHGHFMSWVAVHCPRSHRSCNDYMLYARRIADSQRAANLTDATTIRGMLSFVRDEKENSRAAPQSWPPFLEGLNQIARFVAFVAKHPLASWPPEGREKLAAELAPINAALRL